MQDVLSQAEEYRLRASELNLAHYRATERANRWHRWLGIPVVASAAIVSTSIFATLESSPQLGFKIAAGGIAVAAAVLAALQTFFQFSDVAARHQEAGARYGAVRRQLDVFLMRYRTAQASDRDRALEDLQQLAQTMSELARETPYLSRKLYEEGVKEERRLSEERAQCRNPRTRPSPAESSLVLSWLSWIGATGFEQATFRPPADTHWV